MKMTKEEALSIIDKYSRTDILSLSIENADEYNRLYEEYKEAKGWRDYYEYAESRKYWNDANTVPVPERLRNKTILAFCEKWKRNIDNKREKWKVCGCYVSGHFGSHGLEGIFIGDDRDYYKASYWMELPDACPMLWVRDGHLNPSDYEQD